LKALKHEMEGTTGAGGDKTPSVELPCKHSKKIAGSVAVTCVSVKGARSRSPARWVSTTAITWCSSFYWCFWSLLVLALSFLYVRTLTKSEPDTNAVRVTPCQSVGSQMSSFQFMCSTFMCKLPRGGKKRFTFRRLGAGRHHKQHWGTRGPAVRPRCPSGAHPWCCAGAAPRWEARSKGSLRTGCLGLWSQGRLRKLLREAAKREEFWMERTDTDQLLVSAVTCSWRLLCNRQGQLWEPGRLLALQSKQDCCGRTSRWPVAHALSPFVSESDANKETDELPWNRRIGGPHPEL